MNSYPSTKRSAKDKLILALDEVTMDEALRLVDELREYVGVFKSGLELYARYGPQLLEAIGALGAPLFFDSKFLDIPNTVARASRSLVQYQLAMFNVYASGGSAMMKATVQEVRKEADERQVKPPLVLAVTILTSTSNEVLRDELGINASVEEMVVTLARLAQACGTDGAIASAQEVELIRRACGRIS